MWAHEAALRLGRRDEYDDVFTTNKGLSFKLPENGLEGDELQAALTPLGLDAKLGVVHSVPHSLYEHDLLGVGGSARLSPYDLGRLLAGADLDITDVPGDVLLSKDPEAQNFVTGGAFRLRVPRGQSVHVNGLVAYCIDLGRDVPGAGRAGFDVLGPAGELGNEAMDALQRVADVVAAREPGPLQATPGGQRRDLAG